MGVIKQNIACTSILTIDTQSFYCNYLFKQLRLVTHLDFWVKIFIANIHNLPAIFEKMFTASYRFVSRFISWCTCSNFTEPSLYASNSHIDSMRKCCLSCLRCIYRVVATRRKQFPAQSCFMECVLAKI